MLYLGHPRPHAFGVEDQSLVVGVSAHLGVAMVNAAVAAERDRVASALEATLLPPVLSNVDGVDLAAGYRAAGAGACRSWTKGTDRLSHAVARR